MMTYISDKVRTSLSLNKRKLCFSETFGNFSLPVIRTTTKHIHST